MKTYLLNVYVLSIFLVSCAGESIVKPCLTDGEAICFTTEKVKLEKTGGVEDFNLYTASYNGINFYIYEGNAAQLNGGRAVQKERYFNGNKVTYFENKAEGKYEVLIRRSGAWPQQIHIWINSDKLKDIDKFKEAMEAFSFRPKKEK